MYGRHDTNATVRDRYLTGGHTGLGLAAPALLL